MMFVIVLALASSAFAGSEEVECPSAPVKPDVGDRCEWIPILDKKNCIRKYECMPIPPAGCPEPPQFPSTEANCRWVPIRDSQECIISWSCTPVRSTHDDQTPHCCYWAQIGECLKNPAYMSTYCRASCSLNGCSDAEFFPFQGWYGTQQECAASHRANGCPYQVPNPVQPRLLASSTCRLWSTTAATSPKRWSSCEGSLLAKTAAVGAPRPLIPLPVPSVVGAFRHPALSPPPVQQALPVQSHVRTVAVRPWYLPRPLLPGPPSPPLDLLSAIRPIPLSHPPSPPTPLLPIRPLLLPSNLRPILLPSSLRPSLVLPGIARPPSPPPLRFRLPSISPPTTLYNPCGALDPCRQDTLMPEITIVPVPVKVPMLHAPRTIHTIGFQGLRPANPMKPMMRAQHGPSTIISAFGSLGNFRGALGPLGRGHLSLRPQGPQIVHGVRPPFRLDSIAEPPPIVSGPPTIVAFPKGSEPDDVKEVIKDFGEKSMPRVKLGVKDYREPDSFADKMGLDGKLFALPQYLIDAMSELESEVEARKAAGLGDIPAILGLKLPGEEGADEAIPLLLPEQLLSAIRRYKAALKKRQDELAASRSTTPMPETITQSGTRPPLTFWLGARENTNPPARAFITIGSGGITARPIGAYRRARLERLKALEREERRQTVGVRTTTPVPRTTTDWRAAWITATPKPRQLARWTGRIEEELRIH